MVETRGGDVPLLPPPVPAPTLHSFNSSIVTLRPKPIVISVCLLFVLLLYWTWISASSSKSSFIKTDADLLQNSNLRCINDGYLLTKKIRRCEQDRELKSVKPLEFKPRQVSLTYFGVKGEMGVSWVTYDGDQVRI